MRFGAAAGVAGVLLLFSVCALADPAERRVSPFASQLDELPDGDGKKILQASCTACHDLTEITKFKGYYTHDDWSDIVKTMIAYGATVKASDVEVLVDYLTKTLGKK